MSFRKDHPFFVNECKLLKSAVVEKLCCYGQYKYVPDRSICYGFNRKFWTQVHDHVLSKRIVSLLDENISNAHISEILDAFKLEVSRPYAIESMLNEGLVNLANGVLDITTRNLLPHSNCYNFYGCIPIDYLSTAKCPRWEQFISEVTLDEKELGMILQEMFGYCLVPGNKYQIAFILLGEGENGKSVLLHILRKILGIDNTSSLSLGGLSERFSTIQLVDKLANISDESPSGKAIESEMFKNLTGGGYITVEQKYQRSFQYLNLAKLIFAANSAINLKDQTHALHRRLKIIPFGYKVPKEKRDNLLAEKLERELSGILNWAIEGLDRLLKRDEFTNSKSAEFAKSKFIRDGDNVKIFIDDYCVLSSNEKIKSEELYVRYSDFCSEKGYGRCSDNEFGKRLLSHFPDVKKERSGVGARKYFYKGISLHKDDPILANMNF